MPYKDKQKQKDCAHQSYLRNKEVVLERTKIWQEKHPDKVRQFKKNWAEKCGKEYWANYKWWLKNPERFAIINRRRQHRRKNAEGDYSIEDWQAILKANNSKCACCGVEGNLTVDHIIPLSKGGTNNPENLQPLCRSCNSRKNTRIMKFTMGRTLNPEIIKVTF